MGHFFLYYLLLLISTSLLEIYAYPSVKANTPSDMPQCNANPSDAYLDILLLIDTSANMGTSNLQKVCYLQRNPWSSETAVAISSKFPELQKQNLWSSETSEIKSLEFQNFWNKFLEVSGTSETKSSKLQKNLFFTDPNNFVLDIFKIHNRTTSRLHSSPSISDCRYYIRRRSNDRRQFY